jgi:drug/metabolite transporter (DMT)-like permease
METTTKGMNGSFFIIIAALLWGLDGIMRRTLGGIPPITIIFFEHFIGILILLPFVWKTFVNEKISQRDCWLLILVATLSGLLGTVWFTTALLKTSFISFSVVFLLQKLQPIFAITTSSIFLKEKFEKSYIKWAILAFVAAYFVTFKNGYINFETGGETIKAALYAVGAAFAWGTSTTFSKMILNRVSHQATTLYRFLFTAIISLVVIFALGYTPSLALPTAMNYGTFIIIALTSGMVGLYIYYKGLKNVPVHVSTILELFYPLVAVVIGIFLYGDSLAITQWIAGIILCFAIYKIARLQQNVTQS